MVKAFGLGIAVAIFIDAFIIRTFLVPAIMTLTASINWFFPQCLSKLLAHNEENS
jgi:putative drug exporter of the RND superfamily